MKVLICLLLLSIGLYSCKSTQNCDAYSQFQPVDTLILPEAHIHYGDTLHGWNCSTIPADTIVYSKETNTTTHE